MSTSASFGQGLIASTVLHTAALATLCALGSGAFVFSTPGNGRSAGGSSFISAEYVGGGLPAEHSGADRAADQIVPTLRALSLSREEIPLPAEVSLARPSPRIFAPKPALKAVAPAVAGASLVAPSGSGDGVPASGSEREGQGGGGGGSISGGSGGTGARRAVPIDAPRPPYPRSARADGFEGKVAMQIRIADTGRVTEATLLKSSGRSDTDQAALDTITSRWRFEPAMLDGHPVEWQEKVVVSFQLR